MESRGNKVFPLEGKEKDCKESGLQGTQRFPYDLANGLPPKSSAIELRKLSSPHNSRSGDHSVLQGALQIESESQRQPPSSPGTLMKRRGSNAVNREKMLQKMNATSSDTNPRKRKISAGSYGPILEFSEELNEENEGEDGNMKESQGRGENGNQNDMQSERECVGRKPEDPNQALLQYLTKLSSYASEDDSLDTEHIQSLLQEGASVNICDRFGQTLLHEVSRTWGIDVAQFFIEQGADINKADDYGRTPLHVAAFADYPEMVRFLIENGGDFHVTTKGELQTPLHFAARNEASQCVKILLAYGATLEARDYKERTPLQVAVESNSSMCASTLMEAGASAGTRDDSGMSALTLMVTKMPSVALRALDQFHVTDRFHRKQRYYLNFLDYCDPSDTEDRSVLASPLRAVVNMNCFELVMHPIFQRLLEVKWHFFGKRAWLGIFLNVLLTLTYTVLGITHPNIAEENYYYPLSENYWRIPLEALVVILTFNEIRKEVNEFCQSRQENKEFIAWRKTEIKRDLHYCHPRWTQEKTCIEQLVRQIEGRKRSYFQDRWNYFDWVTYLMLIIVIILHIINVVVLKNKYNRVFFRILACTIILVWIRLLKFARPFPTQGPFVVILDNILGDTIRWGFVVAMFYIPYAVAFWMLFGGRSEHPVEGYDSVFHLAYTIVQYPLVDSYGFERLEKADEIMARVLCGTFLIISAIVLMNLYIALLSNTFQRVYDNARATAAMERARLLQDLESGASNNTVNRYREHIHTVSCPEESDYLVVISEEEDESRKHKEKVSLVHTIVSDRLGGKKFGNVQQSEFDTVLEDINHLKQSHNEMKKLLDRLLLQLNQQGKEQMLAITGVSEKTTSLKSNMEEMFESLVSGIDLRFGTLEDKATLRSNILESNINTGFYQLDVDFKEIFCRYEKYEEEMTARVEDLEVYIVSVEEDKKETEDERTPSPAPDPVSSNGFQVTEADKELADAVSVTTTEAASDGTNVSDLDSDKGDSTERQRRRNITLSGQAARDEYIARLKKTLMKTEIENETAIDKKN